MAGAVSLLALGFGLVVFILEGGRGNDAAGGQVVTSFFFTIAGVFCISEGDGWPRQAASGGWWLKPGAVRSYWLVLLMLALSLVMWGVLLFEFSKSNPSDKALRGAIAAFAYPALYLSAGVIVGRLTPLRRFGEPIATRVGFLSSVVFAVAASMALALVFEGRASGKVMNVLNPLVGMANFIDRTGSQFDSALVLLCSVTLLAVFLAAVVLHGRDEVRSA